MYVPISIFVLLFRKSFFFFLHTVQTNRNILKIVYMTHNLDLHGYYQYGSVLGEMAMKEDITFLRANIFYKSKNVQLIENIVFVLSVIIIYISKWESKLNILFRVIISYLLFIDSIGVYWNHFLTMYSVLAGYLSNHPPGSIWHKGTLMWISRHE